MEGKCDLSVIIRYCRRCVLRSESVNCISCRRQGGKWERTTTEVRVGPGMNERRINLISQNASGLVARPDTSECDYFGANWKVD